MSIAEMKDTDHRRTKRRKLSNDQTVNDRFKHLSEDGTDPKEEDEEDNDDGVRALEPASTRQRSTKPRQQHQIPLSGLNKSSIQSIQLDELLANSRPNYDSRQTRIQPGLDEILKSISNIPETGTLSLEGAESFAKKHHVSIPFPSPAPAKGTNSKFGFARPTSIEVVSDAHLGMGLKGLVDVKLIVEMPKHLLQEKDYLNYRAFHKRAFYLSCIVAHLRKSRSKDMSLKYSLEDDAGLLPGLLLVQTDDGVRKYLNSIFISITFPRDSFSVDKTVPTKNCVREKAVTDSTFPPTPEYNSILNAQSCIRQFKEIIQAAQKSCNAYAQACQAGLLWLRNHKFGSSRTMGGFGGWEWAILCALLLQEGGHKGHSLFSERYSSLQLFKAMLQVLAGRDMTEPWVLSGQKVSIPKSESPVVYDSKTGVNLLHKMTPWSYSLLRQYAQVSLASVNSKDDDALDIVFESPIALTELRFDQVYQIHRLKIADDSHEVLHKLYCVMKRGLGDRIKLLDLEVASPEPWLIENRKKSTGDGKTVQLRLVLNMDSQSRMIDQGPSAEEEEAAAEFRQFWGEKAELRRFKDGSILESLVWSASSPVVQQIVEHLIARHFKIAQDPVQCASANLESIALRSNPSSEAEQAFKLANSRFQSLSSTLHQLQDLPLPIKSISAADVNLRSSALYHALSAELNSPINVLIQFDSSARWPDSLPAIQHTKTAFLLKVSELLAATDSSLTTRVGLEHISSQQSGHYNTSFLAVTYPSNGPQLVSITFRVRIHHDRELTLIQMQLSKASSLLPAERTKVTSALTWHKRHLATPVHTSAIRTLITRFPPLSSTIRLAKSFLSAHHLSNLIPPELIELFCAYVFLHPAPWSVPGSATTAFLRVVYLLSHWDWTVTPLIIDLSVSQDMPASSRDDLKTRFAAWRKLDPNMNSVSWFVGTNVDTSCVVWVEGGRMEKVIAGRVRALAEAVMQTVISRENSMTENDWKSIFVGDTSEYDFVVHLDPKYARGARKGESKAFNNGQTRFKNLALAQQNPSTAIEDIGYAPLSQYLEELTKSFGHLALFLHGEGQSVICGLWRPSVLGEREWRVRLGWSSTPLKYESGEDAGSKDDKKLLCTFNKEGALAEMGLMGAGIVKDIKARE
jgi:U3 small nucleolar RNA-associated protein 22